MAVLGVWRETGTVLEGGHTTSYAGCHSGGRGCFWSASAGHVFLWLQGVLVGAVPGTTWAVRMLMQPCGASCMSQSAGWCSLAPMSTAGLVREIFPFSSQKWWLGLKAESRRCSAMPEGTSPTSLL